MLTGYSACDQMIYCHLRTSEVPRALQIRIQPFDFKIQYETTLLRQQAFPLSICSERDLYSYKYLYVSALAGTC